MSLGIDRRAIAAASVLVLATAAVAIVDRATPRSLIVVNGQSDRPFFPKKGRYREKTGARRIRSNTRITIAGLAANAPLTVEMGVKAGNAPLDALLLANRVPTRPRYERAPSRRLVFNARSSPAGSLDLKFQTAPGQYFVLTWIAVEQPRWAAIPTARVLLYAITLALAGGLGVCLGRSATGLAVGIVVLGGALCGGLIASRAILLAALPSLPPVLAIGLLVYGLGQRCGIARSHTALLTCSLIVRLWLLVQPTFPCIDLRFHTAQMQLFADDQLITSAAPNPDKASTAVPVPYPPALYAAVHPLEQLGPPPDQLLRWTLGLLECALMPFLLFGFGRALGLRPETAGAAAATLAAMPEGALVLAKGIAANVFSASAQLLTLLWMARGAPAFALIAAFALVLLGHFGQAIVFVGLLAALLLYGSWCRAWPRARIVAILLAALSAALLVWLVYYRETFALTQQATAEVGRHSEQFFRFRPIQAGKALQNLILKFGGLPLVLAWIGWRGLGERPSVAVWLRPFVVVGMLAGLGAILTPVPLRFEYFLQAPVALLAGIGIERLAARGQTLMGKSFIWGTFALTSVLCVLLVLHRVQLVSVIMESNRWPFFLE